jgi:hypothetical protein
MIRSFSLFVSHSQLCVFDPDMTEPFNEWSPAHVGQGFSWRRGSVSFRTLPESGMHSVEVRCGEYMVYSPFAGAVRAIEVPYAVEDGRVEIASISERELISVQPACYSLRFIAFAPTEQEVAHIEIWFLRNVQPGFLHPASRC